MPTDIETEALLRRFATGLIQAQQQLDEQGWISCPYPRALQRSFNSAAFLNIIEPNFHWPVNMRELLDWANQPLRECAGGNLPETLEAFGDETLIKDGRPSETCHILASNN